MQISVDVDRPVARFGYLAVAASAVLFSAKSIFIKMCYAHGTPALVLMALRSGFSLPFFLGMALAPLLLPPERRPAPLGRRDLAVIAGLGLLGYYIASVFDLLGLQFLSAGTERLILYVYPSFVVLFSAWIFRKPFPRGMLLPLGLSYAGIALSFGGEMKGMQGGRPYLGGFLVLMSALTYALFLVGQGRMVMRVGPQRLSAYSMLAATAATFVQFLVLCPLKSLIQPAPVYLMTFITALFCTVVPVYLFGYGVKAIGSGRAAVLSSVGPVSTYALAAVLLGEGPGYLQGAGLILVLLGSLAMGKGKSKPVPVSGSGLAVEPRRADTRQAGSGRAKIKLSVVAGELGLEVDAQGKSGPGGHAADQAAYEGGGAQHRDR